MRILIVNDYGMPVGGAELGALSLRDALRARGHDARIFASRACPDGGESFADYRCLGTVSSFRTLLQTSNPWAHAKLRAVLRDFRPDVVHVKLFLTQLSPSILPLLNGVPSLHQIVWYRPICPLGTKLLPNGTECATQAGRPCLTNGCLPLHDWLPLMFQMRRWRRRAGIFDVVVANSDWVKRKLEAEGIRSVEVIHHGLDAVPQRPALVDPPVVAFAGRLVPEKGVNVLLDAFARVAAELPGVQLLIAGGGPEQRNIERAIVQHRLSGKVGLLGHISRDRVEEAFRAAWVQVVPSVWAEPFGYVAAEGAMRGTAVVASNTGGPAEIVRDGETGILVPPGRADELADALRRVLTDRELAERLGRAGRVDALARFSQDRYVDRFVRLYRRMMEKCSADSTPSGPAAEHRAGAEHGAGGD